MEYCAPLIYCILIFLATYGELLHFEVSLDLEGYCFSCGFLSGNSIVCDNDAKQAESCLKSLGWAKIMETDSSLVNAIGVPDFSVIPVTQMIVDNKGKE